MAEEIRTGLIERTIEQKRAIIADALRQPRAPTLHRRLRLGEGIIRAVLFACGAFSIITTVAIVVVLGSEALLFFTPPSWIDSFTALASDINPNSAWLDLTGAGKFEAGQHIRAGEEQMRVTEVGDGYILVERGYNDTTPAAIEAGAEIFTADVVTLIEFFTSTQWQPQLGNFGVLPLLTATVITSLIAMAVALPLGLSAAIYLSEYASPRRRAAIKPILEILAGVPTVVYGYFALTFMTPLLQSIFGDVVKVYNMASAGIVMGVMILPYVSSVSEDALNAVPQSLREASYGLGATRFETVVSVVVPAALSGVLAAFILGISRAIGETMIVALASGAGPAFTFNAFNSAETMTGHIVRISGGDISYNSIDYNSLFAIALALFFMTFFLNTLSRYVTRRFREVYE
ncbi:MAG: phosphate ABC transporter permease subunit PstC [Anaerolineae bacterium]|nr:phosphate ABC transporter permease subunit PstC [Anaerolineae bacterium]